MNYLIENEDLNAMNLKQFERNINVTRNHKLTENVM